MPFWTLLDMTADSGKPTGLPARAYPLYITPSMHHTMKRRYGVYNPGEVGSTAVYIRHLGFTSTLYVRLLMQPYNMLLLILQSMSPLVSSSSNDSFDSPPKHNYNKLFYYVMLL